MILHSYLTPKALGILLSTGKLVCKREHIWDDLWEDSYHWMMKQMRKRLGPEPTEGAYPIWLWYLWEGRHSTPRPYYNDRNIEGGVYRVRFEIPEHLVLLSNFDTWHSVLNNMYLANSVEDLDKDFSREEIEKSWENIFNIDNLSLNRCWGPNAFSIQATVWELTDSMIRKVEHFPPVARRK